MWLLLLGVVLNVTAAAAQDYPSKPIRIIVPYGSGNAGEVALRVLLSEMEPRLGQRVLVEARPGAGGNVGAAAVASAPPDGYTLLLGSANNFVINQHLYKNMGFDPVSAFEPVSIPFHTPFLIYTNAAVPAKTLQEFIAYAKANPGMLNYASSGAGTAPHIGGELFCQIAGIDMTHIPYKGNAQSVAGLLAGEVHMFVGVIAGAQAHVNSGKLRILSTAVPERNGMHPDVPSGTEAGLPKLNITNWWGIVAPRGTPKAVIDKLNDAVQATIRETRQKDRYTQISMVLIGNGPADFAARIRAESAFWGDVIRSRNIRAE
jgi:tripartite-type tricarboxylate transporter receptor subunit TctC